MAVSAEQARAWMEQWQSAAPALEQQRQQELQRLTASRALAASEALLALADPRRLPPHRKSSSGLVEQQALLNRLRR